MSDPLAAMNLNADAYDALLKEAAVDDRVGDKNVQVISVVNDTWASGDPRLKIQFVITDANGAKADLTLSPPPSPEEVVAQKDSWDSRKKKAIANAISIYRQLAQHYGKAPADVREGDTFRVQTAKNKEGFIRVVAFKPKAGENAAAGGTTNAPF